MKVLIIYETVEGQTQKIVRFAADRLERQSHEVQLFDARDAAPVSFENADAVILAAPVHQRRHPRAFEALLSACKLQLDARRTLFFSVSLSAAFEEGLDEAQDYLDEMKLRTGISPDAELLVAGALQVEKYDYFALQVVRHVVLRGRPFSAADSYEFTDWDALGAAVDALVAPSA